MRAAIFTTLALVLLANPATAGCLMSYCKEGASTRSYIVNNSRQVVGDLYSPGHNRRIQIRNNSRQIIVFIETDGSITNRHRQRVLSIEALRD